MQFSRRSVLQSAAAPAFLQGGSRPPNIVFLISDDHTWRDLGCYGAAAARTPNLDRLAAEGVRFENCVVSSPQCSPNRSSILTGCTPHTTSTSRLHTPLPDWEPTFVEPLKQRGYFTGFFRKHHQGAAFEKRLDFYGNFTTPFAKFFDGLPKDRPFFLHAGFTDPHRPYRDGAFTPPTDPKSVAVPPFLPDTAEVRKDLAHYYDFIARMDADCGQLLALLKERGHLENTVVFFTGDNGMPFPRAKGTMYDPGIRVPLLAWRPGRFAPAVRRELIAHVDLPSTWLELAGLPQSAKMQGRSMLPLLEGKSYTPRTEVFSERNWHDNFDPQRCVRTDRWKLIFNAAPHFPYRPAWDLADSPSWASIQQSARRGRLTPGQRSMLAPTRPVLELYDLQTDPNEFHNRIDDPSCLDIAQDLQARLSHWMAATLDYLPPGAGIKGEPAGRTWPYSL
ncbi:MAG: sulfatase [Bryobacter sp.]|nr:sulfatase [Bryobacter sp.]